MSLIGRNTFGKYLCFGIFTAAFYGQVAMACQATNGVSDCIIDVKFIGNYVESTCDIIINNNGSNGTVELPTLSVQTLANNGAEAGSKNFDIALKSCPANHIVTLYFTSGTSAADTTTGNLINDVGTDNSKNVQVRLRKENGSQTVIDDSSTGQDYDISASGDELSHQYTASYYANGDNAVTSGHLNTTAEVELIYN